MVGSFIVFNRAFPHHYEHACVPPSPQKNESDLEKGRLCHIVPNHRTFIEDYLKILDFIEWLKVAYPEKAKFLTEKS